MLQEIKVRKAAQHNLKKIDLELPRNRLILITGPSGSGKSSLAFDTLFAEGQRRYLECLSAYARQFIEQLEKPEVESIEGLSPAISVDQKTIAFNPRSTVGTITEIYDFLRLLYARLGTIYCPDCEVKVTSSSQEQIIKLITDELSGQRVKILAPVVRGRKGEYHQLLERFRRRGYLRARVDGRLIDLEKKISLNKNQKHNLEILIDELSLKPENERRLREALSRSLELADGGVAVVNEGGQEFYFSSRLSCPNCGRSFQPLEPRDFSFNSPYGACGHCHGLGFMTTNNEWGEVELTDKICPVCQGQRLKRDSLSVKIGQFNIHELSSVAVNRLLGILDRLEFGPQERLVADKILKEIKARLKTMEELGLSYLDLSRAGATLSGGEAQRIRLAAQVGSRLRGVMYVLDEPTIGLHQRDNGRLIKLLRLLRDAGNSIIVVEHDEQTIRSADYLVDLGPGAGERGGYVVACGPLSEVLKSNDSLTAQYLRREKSIKIPEKRREPGGWLTVVGAREHNLKNLKVRFPLGVMTAVTGVSGSGKSSLVYDILYKALIKKFYRARVQPGQHDCLDGLENIDKVVLVDQKPIGRTPRSNPATYTQIFGHLRELLAMTPEARRRGYTPGRFSFNVHGGRCEECQGAGVKKIEMHFLPDVYVTCDRCSGRRYNRETLAVTYKGKNISDYLEMTVDEAFELLKAHPALRRKLGLLQKVGLGYLRLGQPATRLSGGEAQRIKLTRELGRRQTGRTLYLLDEPTTGLHFDDVSKLLAVLSELVSLGNTVIVIEHNLEVIKFCDYIIDLGPEGGEEGGYLVAQGTPEEVATVENSHTGRYLKQVLSASFQAGIKG
ncbi:MAG TPA: excinuclease ABC subunit UvrA [Candidatus Saccharicenans sp.]|nr:excinuclease ABC subunit UvrA [Candidatus Saccharicenans sp.]HQO76117.1 excinuclease ABC subunit UvrA [Candidatus Saccharicenans sp.]HUM79321.1 excinuclease ABC subunit UvrA [Candidatus Saccharicenans sp.]